MKKQAVSERKDSMKYGTKKVIVREIVTYPFEEWLGGPQVILMKGVDYHLDSFKMAQQIRNYANLHHYDVSFKTRDHAIAIVVWTHLKGKKNDRKKKS